MSLEKVSFGNCILFALVLAEVTAWTIDLPEVRRYIFEKNAMEVKYEDYKYKNDEGLIHYNNKEGNSKHNSEHYDGVYENAYAIDYGYQSYMEKKVNGIVYKGSMYLEGLRRSLENYTLFLEDCNRMSSRNGSLLLSNSTTWRPAIESSINSTSESQNITDSESDAFNVTTVRKDSENSTNQRCKEATRASDHVRRLSELAMRATRELQDIAYARKYKKGDYHELSKEENELILKLAWFLDRLAHYTGYEPEPRDFVDREKAPTTTTTTPAPFSLVSPPVEVTRAMMECLQRNSSEPADQRCQYPEPLPQLVQMIMDMNSNISEIPAIPDSSSSNKNEQVVPLPRDFRSDLASEQSMELLIASDYRTPGSNVPSFPHFPPILTAVRSVRKRFASSMPEPEVLEISPKFKRSIDDDKGINFLKYYAKHKVWEGSNLKNVDTKTDFEEYEVKNHIATHRIQKRATDKKLKHLRLPENPFQDLSKYIKHKPGVNYIKDEIHSERIRAALEKLNNSKPRSSKTLLRKVTKLFRQKRSVHHEKDVDLPRESAHPQKDISYYTKNKPGRNYNNDLVQAVQLRAGLQQVFNTGNIEVVRRFGSNYNPLIPAPFFAGIFKSQADFKK